jgi:hypothetical protein
VGSIPIELAEFYDLSADKSSGVYSTSNRNKYQRHIQMLLSSRAHPARDADNLTAISESTV